MPCYKIASFENTDLPLIRKVAATGKPMIISTGMATRRRARRSRALPRARPAAAIWCCSNARAPIRRSSENTNMLTIPHLRELFGCEVGLSDHTMGIGVAVAQRRARRHASSRSTSRCRAPTAASIPLLPGARGDGALVRRDRARVAGARPSLLRIDRKRA